MKSILEIDKPDDCFDCPLYRKSNYICMGTHLMVEDEINKILIDNAKCPLVDQREYDRRFILRVRRFMEEVENEDTSNV